jgi:hypothetical protein
MRFEKIYWKKDIIVLNKNFSHLDFDIIDSTLFFYIKEGVSENYGYSITKIAVVHIDEKFNQSEKIVVKYKKIELKSEGWEYAGGAPMIRHWKSGLILANSRHIYWNGAISNSYALLDTAAGTMELWQPSGEFEWLNDECADYKWSQAGWLCLKGIPDTTGFVLLRNGVDTLAVRHYYTSGGRFLPAFSGNSIISNNLAYLINKQGQVSENHLNVRVGYGFDGTFYRFLGFFYDLNGDSLVDYNKFER